MQLVIHIASKTQLERHALKMCVTKLSSYSIPESARFVSSSLIQTIQVKIVSLTYVWIRDKCYLKMVLARVVQNTLTLTRLASNALQTHVIQTSILQLQEYALFVTLSHILNQLAKHASMIPVYSCNI